jgi:hypothetical protein
MASLPSGIVRVETVGSDEELQMSGLAHISDSRLRSKNSTQHSATHHYMVNEHFEYL